MIFIQTMQKVRDYFSFYFIKFTKKQKKFKISGKTNDGFGVWSIFLHIVVSTIMQVLFSFTVTNMLMLTLIEVIYKLMKAKVFTFNV